jgi:hypothetical protein
MQISSSGGGGGGAAADDEEEFNEIVVDNDDGTYTCNYMPPAGAETKRWQLEVLLNGKHIVGSPFAVEVRPGYTDFVFGSMPDGGEYKLSEGGAVATKLKDMTFRGVVADGGGCGPMMDGTITYCEIEIVNNGGGYGAWCFGVCRPDINLNDQASKDFRNRDDTWMMYQDNNPYWDLECNTCRGTGLTIPFRKLNAGDRVGLLLDLDNGGTLTMYLDGKPCGTIAEGLEGPLYPCIMSYFKGKVVEIHSGLALP